MAKKSSHQRSATASKKPGPAPSKETSPLIWAVLGVLVVAVLFGAYQFVTSRNAANLQSATPAAAGSAPITGPEVDGTAQLSGGVQKIDIAVSNAYSPNVIFLKAGVPAELTFSGGQGCTTKVQSQALGFLGDMSAGPAVVKLAGLQPGTYPFACGMNMVHGKIVVQ